MASTSSHVEAQNDPLVSSIAIRLNNLSPVTQGACIYKVPKQLRGINVKSYTPRVVSLGPYTHGIKGLKFMEKLKLRYLETFKEWSDMRIEDLIMFIRKREAEARACYASEIILSSDKFVEIILVDAAFILVTLLNHHFDRLDFSQYEHGNCSFDGLLHDFGLLENQLPLFVLVDLFEKIISSGRRLPGSLLDDSGLSVSVHFLAFKFFKTRMLNEGVELSKVVDASKSCHFVDLLRLCHKPAKSVPHDSGKSTVIRKRSLTLTNLHEAGVKFQESESKNWVDIEFTGGVLKIPYMRIHDNTETILRNIAAFEQCHSSRLEIRYITDYIIAMAKLVNTWKDAEFLAKEGILLNDIGQSEHVANLFYKLDKDALYNPHTFYYAQLFEDLDSHCKISWNKWYASLKHEYLKSPWKIISLSAAVFLILLTLTQTVLSILRFAHVSN